MDRTDKTGLYFHIPFCRSKCPYCDFYSVTAKGCTDEYVNALVDEIKTGKRTEEFIKKDEKIPVDTVYFGGGTPSLLSVKQLENIMTAVRESFILSDDCEITVECNPSSPDLAGFLKAAAALGVNRISLGMQSSSDTERRILGRAGKKQAVFDAVEFSRAAGIENISLDIMTGVPGSTLTSLKDSLDFAINLGVPHISSYMLKIEEGTYYYKNRDRLNLPTEEEAADMYLFMSAYLKEKGFLHYEISNFCKEGLFSRHNMKYWELTPYIGLGAAAHSFFGGKRFYFPSDMNSFINGEKAVFDCEGGDENEELMLSLRTYKGISLKGRSSDFLKKISLFCEKGLGNRENDRFSLTSQGFLLSNSIISALIDC